MSKACGSAEEDPVCSARFGTSVRQSGEWIILTNTERDCLDPIIWAIAREFGWPEPSPRMRGN